MSQFTSCAILKKIKERVLMEKKYNINELYENHIGLIKSRVLKYAKKYNIHKHLKDELYLEANLLFTELFYKHDIDRGKFSTLLVTSLDNHIRNLLKKDISENEKEIPTGDLYNTVFDIWDNDSNYTNDHADNIIEKISLQQKIDSLSIADKEVVKVAMTLTNPESKWAKSRNISKNAIKKYLVELGWRAVDVKRSFNRIELALFN